MLVKSKSAHNHNNVLITHFKHFRMTAACNIQRKSWGRENQSYMQPLMQMFFDLLHIPTWWCQRKSESTKACFSLLCRCSWLIMHSSSINYLVEEECVTSPKSVCARLVWMSFFLGFLFYSLNFWSYWLTDQLSWGRVHWGMKFVIVIA